MRNSPLRRAAALPAALAFLLFLLGGLPGVSASTARAAALSTSIMVDGTKAGLAYDGVGAASGGGGNSRLLIDYPEPQRTQLLDYLFKPNYGANLQVLKLEIGGDTQSTDGAEPSIEHVRGAVDCGNGYEWWLAEQARKRNPAINIYGLAWGAPGWIGTGDAANPSPGKPYFWSSDMIAYLMSWMGCAAQHNLTVDQIGGWNERGFNKTWYVNLKKTLVSKGYKTKVVADDSVGWKVADAMTADPAFKNAVDIIGSHYPCGWLSAQTSCPSSANAQALGKPLWASENGSLDADAGAPALVRGINRGYIDGKMTSFINWPVLAAIYPNLSYATVGMSVAAQPWSGNYHIGLQTWATAHTTQFVAPGWRYIDSASSYLGGNRANGSYVTLMSPNGSDYSSVIETTGASAAQSATFTVSGGLSTGKVHVWATNLGSTNNADYFVRQPDLTPANGSYTLTLQPNYIYTVTTTTGQAKGAATPPAAASLALPYSDDFETAAPSTSPKYFSDMNGAFQTTSCGGARAGVCLRQMSPTQPIRWSTESYTGPYSIMGDGTWGNYTVSADVKFEQPGTVEALGRVGKQATGNKGLNAYHLRLSDAGTWSIVKSDTGWAFTTLASGTVTAPGLNSWHSIALTMDGATLTAKIDSTVVGKATDYAYSSGQAGLGVTGYQTEQFDNFALAPTSHVGAIAGAADRCADAAGASMVNGTRVQVELCKGGAASQTWTWSGGSLMFGAKCLDITGTATANGTPAELWDCNGGTNQQFVPQNDGTLKAVQSGRCLQYSSPTAGTQLTIRDCDASVKQQWTLPGRAFTGAVASGLTGKCANDSGGSTTNGTPVQVWDCNGSAAQNWTTLAGQLVLGGKCMDVNGNVTANGTPVQLWTCNGGTNQQWVQQPDGSLKSVQSGRCLDDPNFSTTNGTQLEIRDCNAGTNQRWTLPT
ncbi:galactosylceramidase [Streptomyces sp. SID13666]|uniref:ricin-type beta-trefoil lectin domain protein n=1 Tax=unclassified Streptomyces TaxID=2593676 RepID=UPI0013C0065C|nr:MULTISPECIES: ricin-type beta-trefoil lectin domain protein [unclassified Streptomyces]NEA59734.1 galactosylceramidase [Streptomyces sp. SID13666]NEA76718.1 galactosylceramidase [Streptomyces sp. SID13588]